MAILHTPPATQDPAVHAHTNRMGSQAAKLACILREEGYSRGDAETILGMACSMLVYVYDPANQ